MKRSVDLLRHLFSSNNQANEKTKLTWLISIRWVTIGTLFLFAAPALIFRLLDRSEITIYLGLLGVLFVVNTLSHVIVTGSKKSLSPLTLGLHLVFDLLVVFTLLFFTGGRDALFFNFIFLYAALGGILIPHPLSWPYLLLIHSGLAVIQFDSILYGTSEPFLDSTLPLFVEHAFVFLFWLSMRLVGFFLEQHTKKQSKDLVRIERQDRLRSLGALTAGFSHELASPLMAARLELERLAQRLPEDSELFNALSSLDQCDQVIHQLNSSQLDFRHHTFQRVSLAELVKKVVKAWQLENPTAKVKLEVSVQHESFVPSVNLSQVLLNLLDNAFEANQQGCISLKVEIDHPDVFLIIQDEGPGFDESILKRLGEPFNTTKETGTGLGLYVAELFAIALQGSLRIQNLAVGGAQVILQWPLREEATQ